MNGSCLLLILLFMIFVVCFADLGFLIASLCGSRRQSLRSGCFE